MAEHINASGFDLEIVTVFLILDLCIWRTLSSVFLITVINNFSPQLPRKILESSSMSLKMID